MPTFSFLPVCVCFSFFFFKGLKTVLLKPRAVQEVETTSFISRRKMLVPLPLKCRAESFPTVQLASVFVGVYFWTAVVVLESVASFGTSSKLPSGDRKSVAAGELVHKRL